MKCRRSRLLKTIFLSIFVYSACMAFLNVDMVALLSLRPPRENTQHHSYNITNSLRIKDACETCTTLHQSHIHAHPNDDKEFGNSYIHFRNVHAFRPSFSTTSHKYVRVEDIAPYNEFEYEHFNISEPMFVREEDRLMFYNFTTGLDLLQPAPYVKRRGVVEVIRNGSYSSSFLCGWPSNYTDMHVINNVRKATGHFKKLCPLLTPEANTFQHFIDGLLPKLMQVRDILLDPEMKVVVQIPRDSDRNFINDVMERIGISKDQIVHSNVGYFTADWMVASCITPPLHPVLWRTARNLLGVNERLSVPEHEAVVVLLTRAKSHNGGRHLLNRGDVVRVLEKWYGESSVVVFKGGYSLKESLSLFGRARLIIGVHGGALYNLNFAPQSAVVLELLPYANNDYVHGLANSIFWSMSNVNGQQYWRIFLKGRNGKLNNVILDTVILEKALSKIDRYIYPHSRGKT